ncbi:MAG: flavodoxin family protein [Acidobacteria bacterium]|nr:flavodoxin family protein [Acidobacteriota bacterium]
MKKVTIVYHSGFGHTRRQAEAVLEGATAVEGVEALLLTTEEAAERMEDLDGSDAIVFGCPTYMGSMSAEMKRFLEAAAQRWFTRSWLGKVAGGFTNSSSFSGDKLNTLVGLMINAMQHGMIWVGSGVMPSANHPEAMSIPEGPGPEAHNRVGSFIGPMAASLQLDDGPPPGDLETAKAYGRRIAGVTLRLAQVAE